MAWGRFLYMWAQIIRDLLEVSMVLRPDRTIRPPKRASANEDPEYPTLARQAGIEGTVVVKITVDERGRVMHASILQSTAQGIFDDAALTAVKQWVFEPAEQSGNKVKATIHTQEFEGSQARAFSAIPISGCPPPPRATSWKRPAGASPGPAPS